MSIHLEIVTPEAQVYSDNVDSVVIPGVEGELGILPMHVPLMTMMKPGELQVKKGVESFSLATGEGFVEITGKNIIILTDMALKAEQIDEDQVEQALKRAQDALAEKTSRTTEEEEALAAMIQKSMAQLNLKRKRH